MEHSRTRPGGRPTSSGPDEGVDVPSALREFILAQAHEPAGAAVVLFTDATLADGGRAGAGPAGNAVGPGAPGDAVAGAARDLGLDPGALDLFSPDAYVLQAALGARLVAPEQHR